MTLLTTSPQQWSQGSLITNTYHIQNSFGLNIVTSLRLTTRREFYLSAGIWRFGGMLKSNYESEFCLGFLLWSDHWSHRQLNTDMNKSWALTMLNLELRQGGIKEASLTEIYFPLSTVTNRLLLSLSSVQEDLTPDPGPWTPDSLLD